MQADTGPLTIDTLRELATRIANGTFTTTVTPHRIGFAIEVGGAYAAQDRAWLRASLHENFDLEARRCGGYVLVKAVR